MLRQDPAPGWRPARPRARSVDSLFPQWFIQSDEGEPAIHRETLSLRQRPKYKAASRPAVQKLSTFFAESELERKTGVSLSEVLS